MVETDENSRILLATCIGEVGAIAVDRLEERSDRICVVKIEQGPWKSRAAKHQLKLVTEQLVTALKAAHSSSDQHKIMFTIQQILALLDRSSYKSKTPDNPTSGGKREMSDWLSALLSDAGVLDVVEPFWWTEFCEVSSIQCLVIYQIGSFTKVLLNSIFTESLIRSFLQKVLRSLSMHRLISAGCQIGVHIWLGERMNPRKLSGVNFSIHVGQLCGLQLDSRLQNTCSRF